MLQGVSYNLGGLEGKKLKDFEAYGGLESENLRERVSSDYLYRSLYLGNSKIIFFPLLLNWQAVVV